MSTASPPRCAFCGGADLHLVMDFGEVGLAGGFLRADQIDAERFYPLRVYFCQDCFAVQVTDIVDPKDLFSDYFYFSSAIRTLREHFEDYAGEVVSRFLDPRNATVVEIGCNDGVLLRPIADQGVRTVIGVDPATNIISTIRDPRITTYNDFFNAATVETILERHGHADLIVANNVYAHIPDINGTTEQIKRLLGDDGVFVCEVHYLGKIIQGLQYDMIYHEHLYYYSLLAMSNHLQRFGLTVFDVKPIPIHGGSMRYYIAKSTSRHAQSPSPRVDLLRREELRIGLDRADTYQRFASEVAARKERLMDLLERLHRLGRRVAGYGASGRANTIIQYCGIGPRHVQYMVDDAPAKHGVLTPGSHLLIRPSSALFEERPDYVVVFAWSYFNEIAERCTELLNGGMRLILPLPEVRLVLHPTASTSL